MKKRIILFTGLLLLAVLPASADNDRAVAIGQMPQKAQQFIKQHFANEKVAYAKMERDFLETRYEVVFVSSAKVEFLKNGDWKEVNCRYSLVPAGIVPPPIAAKAKELYPDAGIIEINRDKRDIEVKLNNRLELTFDHRYNLLEIND